MIIKCSLHRYSYSILKKKPEVAYIALYNERLSLQEDNISQYTVSFYCLNITIPPRDLCNRNCFIFPCLPSNHSPKHIHKMYKFRQTSLSNYQALMHCIIIRDLMWNST